MGCPPPPTLVGAAWVARPRPLGAGGAGGPPPPALGAPRCRLPGRVRVHPPTLPAEVPALGHQEEEQPPPQRRQRHRTRTADSPRSSTPPPEPLQLPDDTPGWDALAGQAANVDALKVALAVLLMPDARRAAGAATKSGVLLTGPPGTGKTLAVRLLAGRAKALNGGTVVPLWVLNGGELLSKCVGHGKQCVRRVMDAATAAQPSIIFFDAFEALAATRTGGRQESMPVIATLLAFLDGLGRRDRVLVVAATSRVDLIDPAFRRPGRFGTELRFGLPDAAGRAAIMRVSAAAVGCPWTRRTRPGSPPTPTTVHAARDAAAPAAAAPRTRGAAAGTDAGRRAGVSHSPLSRPTARVGAWAVRRRSGGWVRRGHWVQRLAAGLPILPQRLLIDGDEGMQQGTVAAAVLHALTPMPIYDAGFVSLTRGAGARTPQQRLAETISAATRAAPAVLFIPHAHLWVDDPSAGDSTGLRFFEAALRDVPVGTPLLVLATTDGRARPALLASFPSTFSVECATDAQRTDYWAHIVGVWQDKFAVQLEQGVRLPVAMTAVRARLEALQTQSADWSVDAMEQVFEGLRALLSMEVRTGVDLWGSFLGATVALDGEMPSVGANTADGVANDDTYDGGGGDGAADGSCGRAAKRTRCV
ncbi:hypothetical protein BU14_0165s0017 [Porphyra umbilicalis]|uniref:AAA+ ATPase domain-containing protein n=1 Tax=Porphyra umbilicalis TaxID=2786 RepID=A0A1X6P8R4_PORUM|nr:hypothetical protein BU14_0165s0017 [Porphyra umbilicalis]|eukprot:OSX77023.1 hypothetical protein BU14_0165s0017 [Porphyra umbilicalis]